MTPAGQKVSVQQTPSDLPPDRATSFPQTGAVDRTPAGVRTPNPKAPPMTAAPADKFAWHRSVTRDARITAGQRLVLGDLLHSVVTGSSLRFRVKQETIAERLNVSLRSVNGAFATATKLGYLTIAQRRSTASGADEHQLTMPGPHADYACGPGSSTRTDCNVYTHKMQDPHARIATPTRIFVAEIPSVPAETANPKVLEEGSLRRFFEGGSGRGASEPATVAAVPSPGNAPSRYCPRHDETNSAPCQACRKAREDLEAWNGRRVAAAEADRRRLIQLRDNCQICDGTNLVDIGNDQVRKCDHGIGEKTA